MVPETSLASEQFHLSQRWVPYFRPCNRDDEPAGEFRTRTAKMATVRQTDQDMTRKHHQMSFYQICLSSKVQFCSGALGNAVQPFSSISCLISTTDPTSILIQQSFGKERGKEDHLPEKES